MYKASATNVFREIYESRKKDYMKTKTREKCYSVQLTLSCIRKQRKQPPNVYCKKISVTSLKRDSNTGVFL